MADLNLGEGDLYIDGKAAGRVSELTVTFVLPEMFILKCPSCDAPCLRCDKTTLLCQDCIDWPAVVPEDTLDAELVG